MSHVLEKWAQKNTKLIVVSLAGGYLIIKSYLFLDKGLKYRWKWKTESCDRQKCRNDHWEKDFREPGNELINVFRALLHAGADRTISTGAVVIHLCCEKQNREKESQGQKSAQNQSCNFVWYAVFWWINWNIHVWPDPLHDCYENQYQILMH